MREQEVRRLLKRIERNCEAIVRLMDAPNYPGLSRAIQRRVQAFANREEQLMWIVGARQSHIMAFHMLHEALSR